MAFDEFRIGAFEEPTETRKTNELPKKVGLIGSGVVDVVRKLNAAMQVPTRKSHTSSVTVGLGEGSSQEVTVASLAERIEDRQRGGIGDHNPHIKRTPPKIFLLDQ
jgi:hypothetical protein